MNSFRRVVITVCGSERFKEQMMVLENQLTLHGYTVLIPCFCLHKGYTEVHRTTIDKVHKHKIDLSDVVIIINQKAIGDHTKQEMLYAQTKVKIPIVLHIDINNTLNILRKLGVKG